MVRSQRVRIFGHYGLGLFEEIWNHATPEEQKELMRLFIHKIVFTPTEVKMALHARPFSSEGVESAATVNREGLGAVDRLSWLPRLDEVRTCLGEICG